MLRAVLYWGLLPEGRITTCSGGDPTCQAAARPASIKHKNILDAKWNCKLQKQPERPRLQPLLHKSGSIFLKQSGKIHTRGKTSQIVKSC